MHNSDSLSVYRSEQPLAGLVLAHGAGAGRASTFMVQTARALASRGITTATFDFPYIAERRKRPDPGPVLEDAWRSAIKSAAAIEALAARPLFIGGKSMGGRIASQVAAGGLSGIRGLVFLGYPLHPPGKPDQRRDKHLTSIAVPMLFVQGSRDAFGSADEIRELLPRLKAPATLYEVAEGDHSFKVPARARVTQSAVLDGVYDAVAAFVRRTAGRTSG